MNKLLQYKSQNGLILLIHAQISVGNRKIFEKQTVLIINQSEIFVAIAIVSGTPNGPYLSASGKSRFLT